ncbi:hypothetical protein Bhyg_07806 [Pseudolycoriella hygida]|uniref:Gustatory receptor n=1 Tax=Pseudolycoriella hygida TaxID=35572 RepID=A0A9Q0S468_9DIPT|nr:hypothetical protein Bhyg_07806 [Pseudolycoriella hygida]
MNFLVYLNRILLLLLFFGLCPMSLNKEKTEVTSTFFELCYIGVYLVAFSLAIGFFGYYAFFTHGIEKIIKDTASISGYSQTVFVIIIFYSTIVVAVCHKKAQAKYFNRVNSFDEKLINKLKIGIENSKMLCYMIYQYVLIIIAELILYTTGQLLEGFPDKYVFIFQIFCGFMVLTITLAALHVRNCGIILTRRFSILYNQLDRITDSPSLSTRQCEEVLNVFDLVEDLFVLKHKFGKAFGFQLLLNSAFDFIYLTIDIYYVLMSLVSNGFQWSDVYKFLAFSLTHIVKNVMLVFVMENLASQVDEIRKIATKASLASNREMSASLDLLFLKLQHMEKTKYITANDFFPINYAMLYNMGAAIVTHMMILLQFQQWEDSQKLLASENGTVLANVSSKN